MFPTLIDLGTHDLPFLGSTHLFLPTYGLLFALGVLTAWWWFTRRARGLGVPDDELFDLAFYTLLAGILGAKLLLVVVDWRVYMDNPRAILGTLRSAGVLAGGVLAGSVTFALYARSKGLPLFRLADAIAAPLALAQGIGRLGCHASGCCWGVETHADNPFSVVFTNAFAQAQTGVTLNVPLVATQLIQMVHDLLLALVLTWMWRRQPRPPGTVFWTYVLVYSVGRGIIEFWRGDSHRGVYFGEWGSTSQILALLGIALSLTMLLRGYLGRRRTAST